MEEKLEWKIDNKLDELDHRIDLAKETLAHLRKLGETGRELSLVMTKLDEAELWLAKHREKKEVGSNEAC